MGEIDAATPCCHCFYCDILQFACLSHDISSILLPQRSMIYSVSTTWKASQYFPRSIQTLVYVAVLNFPFELLLFSVVVDGLVNVS